MTLQLPGTVRVDQAYGHFQLLAGQIDAPLNDRSHHQRPRDAVHRNYAIAKLFYTATGNNMESADLAQFINEVGGETVRHVIEARIGAEIVEIEHGDVARIQFSTRPGREGSRRQP